MNKSGKTTLYSVVVMLDWLDVGLRNSALEF